MVLEHLWKAISLHSSEWADLELEELLEELYSLLQEELVRQADPQWSFYTQFGGKAAVEKALKYFELRLRGGMPPPSRKSRASEGEVIEVENDVIPFSQPSTSADTQQPTALTQPTAVTRSSVAKLAPEKPLTSDVVPDPETKMLSCSDGEDHSECSREIEFPL